MNCLFIAHGQNISGIVLDADTNEPLEGVNIVIAASEIGSSSDKDGHFEIKVPKNNQLGTLHFSMVGYENFELQLSDSLALTEPIYLIRKTEILDEITVLDKKRKKRSRLNYSKLTTLKPGVAAAASKVFNGKIYISGGNLSVNDEVFKKAAARAEAKAFGNPTFRMVQNEMSADMSFAAYYDGLQIYDIETDYWIDNNFELSNRSYHNIENYNGNLYVIGGKSLSARSKDEYLVDTIEVIKLDSLKVTTDLINPHKAVNFASAVYKDKIIVLGGSISKNKSGKKTYSRKVDFYNITTGLWYNLTDMPVPMETQCLLIDDTLFLVGGFNGEPYNKITSLDLISGKWSIEKQLPYGMRRPALTSVNNLIYIYENSEIMVYDIHTKNIRSYKIGLNLEDARIHLNGDKLYIIGGMVKRPYYSAPSNVIYTLSLREFEKTSYELFTN